MNKTISGVALATAIMLAIPQAALAEPKPVELTEAQRAALQTKTYQVPFTTAFPATIAVLQSLGYLNVNASKDAGTISAETESKAHAFYNVFTGIGKKKFTQKASIFIEQIAPGRSTIRLNLTVSETKSRLFGSNFSDGAPVKIAEPYTEFYTALDAEMARRQAQ